MTQAASKAASEHHRDQGERAQGRTATSPQPLHNLPPSRASRRSAAAFRFRLEESHLLPSGRCYRSIKVGQIDSGTAFLVNKHMPMHNIVKVHSRLCINVDSYVLCNTLGKGCSDNSISLLLLLFVYTFLSSEGYIVPMGHRLLLFTFAQGQ